MLLLVRVGLVVAVVIVEHLSFPIGKKPMVARAEVGLSLGALEGLVHSVGCTWEMAALGVNHAAIRIGEGQDVVVKNLPMLLAGTYGTSSSALCFDWIAIFGPVGYVNVVHVLLHDMVSTKPVEVVPIAHLVFHLRLVWSSWLHPNSSVVPVHLTADNIAENSVLNTLHGFPVVVLVVALQAHDHIQFLRFGYLSSS